jgi:Predicted HD superfamily hydrolase
MEQTKQHHFDEKKWFTLFANKAHVLYPSDDPAHDYLHIMRVVQTAKHLCEQEKGNWAVIMPAAFFHDFINVPKNDPRREIASKLSAEAAIEYLQAHGYPAEHFDGIRHAIEAHSFSAGIKAETLEAQIVQDADRLDSLGAIGIARCFATTSRMARPFYNGEDPWATNRELDDKNFGIDHFFKKLFLLVDKLNTPTAKAEGEHRVAFIKTYLDQIKREI